MDAALTPALISVLFAGDVTLGYHYEEYVEEQVSKGRTREEMDGWGFQRVAPLTQKADLFVVNLECPFTTRGEKIPKNFNFRASPSLHAALKTGGVDAVTLANNHLMDYGEVGLLDTIKTLDEAKIRHFGAGANLAAAREPAIIKVRETTFALLGYFFLGDRNIEPKEVIATEKTPGVAGHFSDLKLMKQWVSQDIKKARRRADVVIPFFHWGREGYSQPEPYQVELAHAAIDAGASAVIGSHPHVLQGVEMYRGAPIAYSLGNFVFGGNWNPRDKRTALLELQFEGKKWVKHTLHPAFTDNYPEVPVQPYLASGDGGTEILSYLETISSSLAASGTPPTTSARPSDPTPPTLDAGR